VNNIALVMTLILILGAYIALASAKSNITGTVVYRNYSLLGGIIKQANGSTTETIKLEEVNNSHLNTEVKLEVSRGTVFLELLDDNGQPTASVVSTPGKPGVVRGHLVADASGAVRYRITATEAENIEYSLTVHH
jgi:hypothetical protein